MFSESSPDDGLPDEIRALIDRAGDTLMEELLAIGVHVSERLLALREPEEGDPEGLPRAAFSMTGVVKDVAFSDRVLRPDRHTDADVLAAIDEATIEDEFERNRRALLERNTNDE